MTISQIRRRIDALKRRFARELAIIKLRRIAEAVSDQWDPDLPPEPADVIQRVADAGFPTTHLRQAPPLSGGHATPGGCPRA